MQKTMQISNKSQIHSRHFNLERGKNTQRCAFNVEEEIRGEGVTRANMDSGGVYEGGGVVGEE